MTDSTQGERGPVGETGEAGVAGRQGEAGVAGRQGEVGAPGAPGTSSQGKVGPRGQRGASLSRAQILALFLFVVTAFVVLALRTEIQQRQIQHNSQQIARTQYEQCKIRNEATVRQNTLIDSAIAAERRKPNPDAKRIRDLLDFRGAVPDCGRKPT